MEVQLMADQCNSLREKLEQELESARNYSEIEQDKLRDKLTNLENSKFELYSEYMNSKAALVRSA